jgi:protease I
MKVLILGADGFEDLELMYPLYRVREEGHELTLAGKQKGKITGKHGYEALVDMPFSKVDPAAYDMLIIPGGKAPESVRLDMDAIKIVRHFFEKDKLVGSICHGIQVLISAGVLKGREVTCWKGVKDDAIAAGAKYHDREAVVDGNLVTSRMPDDLPAFIRELHKVAHARAGKVGKAA